jgi:hypothetical protein
MFRIRGEYEVVRAAVAERAAVQKKEKREQREEARKAQAALGPALPTAQPSAGDAGGAAPLSTEGARDAGLKVKNCIAPATGDSDSDSDSDTDNKPLAIATQGTTAANSAAAISTATETSASPPSSPSVSLTSSSTPPLAPRTIVPVRPSDIITQWTFKLANDEQDDDEKTIEDDTVGGPVYDSDEDDDEVTQLAQSVEETYSSDEPDGQKKAEDADRMTVQCEEEEEKAEEEVKEKDMVQEGEEVVSIGETSENVIEPLGPRSSDSSPSSTSPPSSSSATQPSTLTFAQSFTQLKAQWQTEAPINVLGSDEIDCYQDQDRGQGEYVEDLGEPVNPSSCRGVQVRGSSGDSGLSSKEERRTSPGNRGSGQFDSRRSNHHQAVVKTAVRRGNPLNNRKGTLQLAFISKKTPIRNPTHENFSTGKK